MYLDSRGIAIDRKPIFDAVRLMLGRSFTPEEVAEPDAASTRPKGRFAPLRRRSERQQRQRPTLSA